LHARPHGRCEIAHHGYRENAPYASASHESHFHYPFHESAHHGHVNARHENASCGHVSAPQENESARHENVLRENAHHENARPVPYRENDGHESARHEPLSRVKRFYDPYGGLLVASRDFCGGRGGDVHLER